MLITLARKPLGVSTVVQTCLAHGTGALNIDASRIGTGTGAVTTVMVPDHRSGNFGQDTAAYKDRPKLAVQRVDQGRWPANLLHDGSEAVLAGFPDTTSGKPSGIKKSPLGYGGNWGNGIAVTGFGDTGSAARFFKQINGDSNT